MKRLAPVLLIAALIPTTAFAQTPAHENFELQVEANDLDLTTQDGAERLDQRARTQIRKFCQTGARDYAALRAERECQRTALASATRQVQLAVANANADRIRLAKDSTTSDENTPNG